MVDVFKVIEGVRLDDHDHAGTVKNSKFGKGRKLENRDLRCCRTTPTRDVRRDSLYKRIDAPSVHKQRAQKFLYGNSVKVIVSVPC
jgi:hypothetical protein